MEESTWGVTSKHEEGKDGPERNERWRGRTWNRIMAAVSVRTLLDRIQRRLDWSAVPWWTVGSAYTSQTDLRHAVVDARQRPNGSKVFTALADGRQADADLVAAGVHAGAALARPLDAVGSAARDRILAQAPAAKPRKKKEAVAA